MSHSRCVERSAGVLLMLLALALPTSMATNQPAPADCISPALLEKDFKTAFPEHMRIIQNNAPAQAEVAFAQGFSAEYFDTYKVVKNTAQKETYVLYQCGTVPPEATDVPEGAKFFQIPLTAASVPDTTALAFLDVLGLSGRVKYASPYSVNSCMQSLGGGACGKVALSPGSSNATLVAQQASGIDAFFVYGANANSKSIAITASPERGMLQRAEWVKFVSLFFNKEPEANTFFKEVTERYNAIKNAAAAADEKPLIAFISYTPPQWGEALTVSFAEYKQQLAEDAGGRYLDEEAIKAQYPNATFQWGSLSLNPATDAQTLKDVLKDVAVVVDESGAYGSLNPTLEDFLNRFKFTAEDVANFPFLRDQQILREDAFQNPDGFTSWFEGAVPRPDLVLLDLATAIAASDSTKVQALKETANKPSVSMLRNLLTQPAVLLEAKECPLATCSIPSAAICPFVYEACDGSVAFADENTRCSPECEGAIDGDGDSDATSSSVPPPSGSAFVPRPFVLLAVACVALSAFLGM